MVFVSTSCLKGRNALFEKDLSRVLDVYKKLGIRQIELGAALSFIEDLSWVYRYQKENCAEFTVHGFFPPAKKPFMINIGSQTGALDRAVEVTLNAIDFCRKTDTKVYTLHGAFLAEIDLEGNALSESFPYSDVFATMVSTLSSLCDRAGECGITMGVENHPPANKFGVMMDYPDFLKLFREVGAKNLGVLVDIGHLNLAAGMTDLNPKEFISRLKDRIVALHCHQVVGGKDHNAVTDENILSDFDSGILKKAKIVLEANSLSPAQITGCVNVLEKAAGSDV